MLGQKPASDEDYDGKQHAYSKADLLIDGTKSSCTFMRLLQTCRSQVTM